MEAKKIIVAVIGATGLVGRKIFEVLDETLIREGKIHHENIIGVASDKTASQCTEFQPVAARDMVRLVDKATALSMKPDIVLMSVGSEVSLEWAPKFAKAGAYVIDNSSAWRMDSNVPLIVPGISDWNFNSDERIIANPNCVAIMLATGIYPFMRMFGEIKYISATVMQAVSGAGYKGIKAYEKKLGRCDENPFPGRIVSNILPAAKKRPDTDYNEEEWKVMEELPKILGTKITISPTNLRSEVIQGHSAVVRIYLEEAPRRIEQVINMFHRAYNIKYSTDEIGPLNVIDEDYALVSNAKIDRYNPNIVEFFITSDNLRMGAASNAVSIMKKILMRI